MSCEHQVRSGDYERMEEMKERYAALNELNQKAKELEKLIHQNLIS